MSTSNRASSSLLDDPQLGSVPVIEGFKFLDPVVLYAKVGQGGMGSVYRGRHVKLEIDVAVKCLSPLRLHEDPGAVRRFQREARLAAEIIHQNLVHVMDVDERHGLHYLIMEYVRGENARQRVRRKGALAESEALAIAFGAAQGLAAAHGRSIVHRDIKPDNVMITPDGHVKLADLGLGKNTATYESLSVSTALMGTPQYMPPEQWQGIGEAGMPGDVWALGATLYFLLAGRDAIPRTTHPEICRRICDHDFPSIVAERPDVSAATAALIAACTRRAMAERPSNALDLVARLRELVRDRDGVPVDEATASDGIGNAADLVSPPPADSLARIRLRVQSGGVSDPVGEASEAEPATVPTARQANPARQRPRRGWFAGVALAAIAGVAAAGWLHPEWFGLRQTPAEKPGEPLGPKPPGPKPPPEPGPSSPIEKARKLAEQGKLDGAIALLEAQLAADLADAPARALLVTLLDQRSERRLAQDDLDGAAADVQRSTGLSGEVPAGRDRVQAALRARLERQVTLRRPDAALQLVGAAELEVVAACSLQGVEVSVALQPDAAAAAPRDAVVARRTADEFRATVTAQQDGPCWLSVRARDPNGAEIELPRQRIVFDLLAPRLEITAPADRGVVPGMCSVRGTVADRSAVRLTVNGDPVEVEPGDGSFACTRKLAAGDAELRVVAVDAFGRTTDRVLAVQVDTVAPRFVSLAPQREVCGEEQATIQGRLDDPTAGLALDSRPIALGPDGTFEVSVELPAEGPNTFVFTATDAVGNSTAGRCTVRRDLTRPQLRFVRPDPAVEQSPGSIEVVVAVTDDSDVEVQISGQPATVRVAGGEPSTVPVPIRLGPGESRELVVEARDLAGNTTVLRATFRAKSAGEALAWGTNAGDELVAVAGKLYPRRVRDTVRDCTMILVVPPRLVPYYLDETEVTWKQWRAFHAQVAGAYLPPAERYQNEPVPTGDAYPLYGASPSDIDRFLRWAGNGLRLPKDAEWEYAAGGGEGWAFPWGDESPVPKGAGNYGPDGPAEVRSFTANPLGFFDLGGNVWELTRESPNAKPAWRGSSWYQAVLGNMRVAYRREGVVERGLFFVGFRAARSL